MRYFSTVSEFISCNDTEIQKIIFRICNKHFITCYKDISQEFYKQLIAGEILKKYDPNHPTHAKISTYLYRIIENIVLVYKKSGEFQIEKYRLGMDHYDFFHQYENGESLPSLDTLYNIKVDYENILYQNEFSDTIDGIGFDLDLFEDHLKKKNKHYDLKRRKNKNIGQEGLDLLDVFQLMREGYTNREIAHKFGVSDMWITTIKSEIKDLMIKFGIIWNYRSQRDRSMAETR
jgi:hypothetical protein